MPSRIYWTRQAQNDLRAIREHIARDAPVTAVAFVGRLKQSTERLREFPYSGRVVPEYGREEVREVLQGNYRLIYRITKTRIDILAVYHTARLLGEPEQ